jgi:hypothetical protein
MSGSDGVVGSRLSNGCNPPHADSGPDAPDFDSAVLPTPAERVQEALKKYPDRMFAPVSVSHGRKLREEALAEPELVERSVATGDGQTKIVADVASRGALPWVAVLEEFLSFYESYRDAWLKLQKGTVDPEEFEIPLDTSWSREANDREYARWKGLTRETCGGERPSGEHTSGRFAVPAVGMLTFSSSSTTREGEPRSPVDHDRELVESWGGSDGIKRSVEYVMGERLGLDRSSYVWRKQAEPHTSKRAGEGYGKAAGYSHHHVVLIFDAAEIEPELPVDGEGRPAAEVLEQELRRPIEKHVEECGRAGESAHGSDAVTVGYVGDDDVKNPAQYAAKYVAVDTEHDLLERPVEYLMWASVQWASSTRKFTQSNRASAAIAADSCKQEYESDDSYQHRAHGEKVVRSDRPGVEFECMECGSPWGIEQDAETVTEAVMENRSSDDDLDADASLAELWPSADAAARVGEPVHEPGEDVEVERESFERERSWRPVSIRRGEEEYLIGGAGGSVYGEVVVEGADAIPPEKLIPPDELRTPSPDVDPTKYPPPELIEQQLGEIHRGDMLTPKEWPVDWHDQRYGGDVVEFDLEPARRYVENTPGASVGEVSVACDLPPSVAASVLPE